MSLNKFVWISNQYHSWKKILKCRAITLTSRERDNPKFAHRLNHFFSNSFSSRQLFSRARSKPINFDRKSDSWDSGLTVCPGLTTFYIHLLAARQNPTWVDRTRTNACAIDRELLSVPDPWKPSILTFQDREIIDIMKHFHYETFHINAFKIKLRQQVMKWLLYMYMLFQKFVVI